MTTPLEYLRADPTRWHPVSEVAQACGLANSDARRELRSCVDGKLAWVRSTGPEFSFKAAPK